MSADLLPKTAGAPFVTLEQVTRSRSIVDGTSPLLAHDIHGYVGPGGPRGDFTTEALGRYADAHTDTQKPPESTVEIGEHTLGALEGAVRSLKAKTYTAPTQDLDGSQVDLRWMKVKYGPPDREDMQHDTPAVVPEGPHNIGDVLDEHGRPFLKSDRYDLPRAVRIKYATGRADEPASADPRAQDDLSSRIEPVAHSETPLENDTSPVVTEGTSGSQRVPIVPAQRAGEKAHDVLGPIGSKIRWAHIVPDGPQEDHASEINSPPAVNSDIPHPETSLGAGDQSGETVSTQMDVVPARHGRLRRLGWKAVAITMTAGSLFGLNGNANTDTQSNTPGVTVGATISTNPNATASPADRVVVDLPSDESVGGTVGKAVVDSMYNPEASYDVTETAGGRVGAAVRVDTTHQGQVIESAPAGPPSASIPPR